jgi:hypothetical protein
MTSRRDFLRKTGSAAALAATGSVLLPEIGRALTTSAPIYPRGVSAFEELPIKELLADALTAAKAAGASWSDAASAAIGRTFSRRARSRSCRSAIPTRSASASAPW